MKNENSENRGDSELQKEIDKRLQDLIDQKKSESEALRKMLHALLEKNKEYLEKNGEN